MQRSGNLAAFFAYFLWGILPIYWKQIAHIPAAEILAHRMAWSLVFVALILIIRREWQWVKPLLKDLKNILIFIASALLIGINWFTYIYAVNSNLIVEASLGYFINPLFSVVLGLVFFREQLRPLQWLAVGLALIGVVWLTVQYGRLPWVAIILTVCFGLYGLLRKIGRLESNQGLFVEMSVWFIPAVFFLLTLDVEGTGSFGRSGLHDTVYLAGAGAATMLPLIFFTYAAKRVKLSTLGILQYLAPIMQFLIGVLIYKEAFSDDKLVGFLFIWTALVIYTVTLLKRKK